MKFLNTNYFKFGIIFLILLLYESIIRHDKDFDVFIGASKLIFEGKTCYEVWLMSGTSGLKYFYSPLFAVLLFPLKALPQIGYNLFWIAFNLVIIYRVFQLLPFFLPVNKFSKNKKALLYILGAACSARFILDNLDLGQMTFLMVWGSLESVRLFSLKKYMAGSALLAIIINIKIIPIAILPWLIYKREFRAVLLTGIFLIAYLFLPSVFIGYSFNNDLLHSWLSSLSGTTAKSIFDDAGRPSLSSLIPSLFMDSDIQFSVKRNILNLDAASTNIILNAFRILILIFLMFLFGKPFQKMKTKKAMFYEIALICLVTPLIFPHQGKYSFFYLMPAYFYCSYTLIKLFTIKSKLQYGRIYFFTLVFILISFAMVTVTTDGIIGRRLSDFTEYLHFITYGALSLLFAMAFVKPRFKPLVHY